MHKTPRYKTIQVKDKCGIEFVPGPIFDMHFSLTQGDKYFSFHDRFKSLTECSTLHFVYPYFICFHRVPKVMQITLQHSNKLFYPYHMRYVKIAMTLDVSVDDSKIYKI